MTPDLGHEVDHVVREGIEVRPQLFLAHVALGTALDADDAGSVAQLLDGHRVLRADRVVDDAPREEIAAGHVVAFGLRPRQFDDILGLPTSIGVTPELEVVAAKETVDADQAEIQTWLVAAHGPRGACTARAPCSARLPNAKGGIAPQGFKRASSLADR
jgi:hypothetical protein